MNVDIVIQQEADRADELLREQNAGVEVARNGARRDDLIVHRHLNDGPRTRGADTGDRSNDATVRPWSASRNSAAKTDLSATKVEETPLDKLLDKQGVIAILNDALASKVVSVLRYRRHYFMAQGLAADAIKKEFLLHAEQEQAHADQLAKRIIEIGGKPDFNPRDLTSQSHAEYAAGKDLENMIKEDLIAEHGAVESFREMTAYLAERDPLSLQMLGNILATEVEQTEELASMLGDLQSLLSLWRAPLPMTSKSRPVALRK